MKYYLSFLSLFVITIFISSFGWTDIENISIVMEKRIGLTSNDHGDLAWDGNSLWISGSGTISKRVYDSGNILIDWITFHEMVGFGQGSISSLLASGDTLVVAWVYDDERDGDNYISGDGYSISSDSGETWRHVEILDLFPERSDFQYPGTYTMTYDFSLTEGNL